MWLRIPFALWRLAWPYPLAPWRSPLVRWRIETYGITRGGRLLHAEELTASDVLGFIARNRRQLLRFLRWAAAL